MDDSNRKSMILLFLTPGVIWLAGMATLLAISHFQGLKGLVALSFAALFSTLIASLRSAKCTATSTADSAADSTESEEVLGCSRRLSSGESGFKLLIPFCKFLILVLSLYLVIYFSVAQFFDGMQMAWAFVASLLLVGVIKMVCGKENPIKVISATSGSTANKSFLGTFLVVGVPVTLTFCLGLMALPIQTYPIPLRALIVLIWFCCYFKLIYWLGKRCGSECAVPDNQKNDSLEQSDGSL